jgi:hypothetical protein
LFILCQALKSRKSSSQRRFFSRQISFWKRCKNNNKSKRLHGITINTEISVIKILLWKCWKLSKGHYQIYCSFWLNGKLDRMGLSHWIPMFRIKIWEKII